MPIDSEQARRYLRDFDFKPLFNELGWDRHNQGLTVDVKDITFQLEGVAQKRGVQVFHCPTPNDDGLIPDNTTLRKIERKVRQAAAENLIIFTDQNRTEQKWYWVRRLVGEPDRPRHVEYIKGRAGDQIIQRLNHLLVTLEDEEQITTLDAAAKLQKAFDTNAEKVTKRFFKEFQNEHKRFLGFIEGLADAADQRWYASIMLNRLMFIYFIQKKGFLDGDQDYLRNRLVRVQSERGEGHFMSFYRCFLRRLMHEGLGSSPGYRSSDLEGLIGRVPYLNGGIFAPHMLELTNPDIDIPDQAFEHIFDFFDQYRWHLDDRKERLGHRKPDDNEINPDVLGYIFEKYINQKQMGAYYTKEDITQYISQNTIIPFLFDKARTDKDHGCANAFRPNAAMWKLLADEPDRYIYDAVRKGVIQPPRPAGEGRGEGVDEGEIIPLPENIAAGIDDVPKRGDWNKPADEKFALPTEIWREHVARRQRCLELREKLAAGEVNDINDLITLNLNIRLFAQDVIEECEGPELLRAFWHALTTISVLDPTCGSGAFLFATMDILEPLYEACLTRMQDFIATAEALTQLPKDRQPKLTKRQKQAYDDFRATLAEIDRHPNHAYFIFKTIVLNNLYGVDIMDEATEICRLRLFLKLIAQVEPDAAHPNLGVEPLPDIDFNIKTGNTLVGFTSIEEVATASERAGRLGFDAGIVERIQIEAGGIAKRFREFRDAQQAGEDDSESLQRQKRALTQALQSLADQLDNYLAGEYGIDADDPKQAKRLEKWRETHQPFHWISEFYGVMGFGGFDVVIGNPPYVETRKVCLHT